MEFAGVGYQELIVIMVLLLVVVGPERLPTVAYQVGRAVRQMQRYARAVRDEFSEELSFIDEQYQVVRGSSDTLRESLRTSRIELDQQLRVDPIASAPAPTPAPTADSPAPEASSSPTPPDSAPTPPAAKPSNFIF